MTNLERTRRTSRRLADRRLSQAETGGVASLDCSTEVIATFLVTDDVGAQAMQACRVIGASTARLHAELAAVKTKREREDGALDIRAARLIG